MDKNFLDTLSKDGDAYLISSAEDLCNLSEYVNAGNDCDEKIFKLANDIDLSSVENFTPIGTYDNDFAGTFDGDGKTISNLKIVGENYVGLFGCVDEDGTIQNVHLNDTIISGNIIVGSLIGRNDGYIKNCSFSGSVRGKYGVGGLVSYNEGKIENCSASSKIRGKDSVGGFVGSNGGKIQNCTFSGTVSNHDEII